MLDGTQISSFPAVVEEFYNHGGVQLKCYVIDGHVHVHVKASFPDVHLSPGGDGSSILLDGKHVQCSAPFTYRFHSLKSMPETDCAKQKAELDYDIKMVHACARYIGQQTRLKLFGFDLIQCSKAGSPPWALIDVNAFPSFKGVPDAAAELRACLQNVAASQSH